MKGGGGGEGEEEEGGGARISRAVTSVGEASEHGLRVLSLPDTNKRAADAASLFARGSGGRARVAGGRPRGARNFDPARNVSPPRPRHPTCSTTLVRSAAPAAARAARAARASRARMERERERGELKKERES